MKRYLLDTCALIWLLMKNKRMEPIAYDIDYYLCDCAVSIESIKELLYLIQSGKLKIDISLSELIKLLLSKHITIYLVELGTLKVLSELPFFRKHPDPSDRVIIAHAIAENRILVSGDMNFKLYPNLQLLAV